MKTIGTILREAREERGASLDDVAKTTRIRADFLEALENEEFNTLPRGPFVKGFIRTYASELGLNPEHCAAVYRRDYAKDKIDKLVPTGMTNPIKKHMWFAFTPQSIAVLFIAAVIGGFLLFQVSSFNQPPALIVLEPQENQEVRTGVVVRGRTATDCIVKINGESVAVDQDGGFSVDLMLLPGEQKIQIESTNRKEKTRVVQRNVHVVE